MRYLTLYSENASRELAGRAGVLVLNNDMYYQETESCIYPNPLFNPAPLKGYIIIDGKEYFMKRNYVGENQPIFEDFFAAFLAKKMGLNCVSYKLLIDDIHGIIAKVSENFGEHYTLDPIPFTHGKDISVYQLVGKIIELFPPEQGYFVSIKQMVKDLRKLCCFDFLVSEEDRRGANIAVVIEIVDGKKVVKLSKIYDNEHTFDPYIDDNKQSYKLNPLKGKYGMVHREIMQTNPAFISLFNKFKSLVDDEHIDKTLREFECVYGFGKLFSLANEKEVYEYHVSRVKKSLKRRLEFMQQDWKEMQ